jgi:Fe-S-cluster containining protein
VIEQHDGSVPDALAGSQTIAFSCHGCGDCCRGSTILLTPFDLARLAVVSGESPRAILKERCVVLKHPQLNLPTVMLETIPQCSFLDEANRCTVYVDRPLVCRGYPLGVMTDLNAPGWRPGLQWFSLRPNPCPPPRSNDAPLPIVRTLHQMATDAGMEAWTEAYRVWARLSWDIAANWRYDQMPAGEALAFDGEFVRTFFEEVDTPREVGAALIAFVARVKRFRARHDVASNLVPQVSSPPGAPSA